MQTTAQFHNKKVLLTAFSTAKTSESLALYAYLKDHGCTDISTLYWGGDDVKRDIPNDIHAIHINSHQDIKSIDKSAYDIVFRHTSVTPDSAADAKQVMTSTQLFLNECNVPIIGVTGTKGKGTTSTLIAKMLEQAGIKTWLVGNVGLPALAALSEINHIETKDAVVVYEMSSFQLWDIKRSPGTAVVLMIEPDHLDVHKDFEEYVGAKANIARYQKPEDLIVYHPTNKLSQSIAEISLAHQKKRFLTSDGAYVKGDDITIDDITVCSVKDVSLPGQHNLQNICAAITAVWKYTQNTEAIAAAIKNFTGLEHRLKFVKTVKGVKYYDDSIATTPGSALAALNAFNEQKILILGGSSKGADFNELTNAIKKSSSIKKLILIGDEAKRIAQGLDEDIYEIITDDNMTEIVNKAAEYAEKGDIVILSPACASFGMFKNYSDRGNKFIRAVEDRSAL